MTERISRRAGPIGWVLVAGWLVAGMGLRAADPAPRTSRAPDAVWFVNGDHLRGELLSLDPQGGVLWRHPDIQETIPFNAATITKIRLGERAFTPLKPAYPCRVRLVNQDELEGNLVAWDAHHLVLDTWYAGPLSIPRPRLDALLPLTANPAVVFEGPTGLEGWTVGTSPIPGTVSGTWQFSQGGFVTAQSASIARDLKLPDCASLEFDLAWSGYLSIAVALYADSLQPIQLLAKDNAPEFGPFYSLQLSLNSANLMPVKKGAPLNSLGMAFIPGLEQRTSAHVGVRMNKADRAVYLFLDGALVKQWQDPVEFLGRGTCVRFVNQVAAPMKISNLVVAQWDGRLETPLVKIENATNDFIRLMNRDVVSGAIQGFKDGTLAIVSAMGPLEIPLARIVQVHLARTGRAPVTPLAGETRAHFTKRGQVSLVLEQWEDGRLVASSPNFGRAKFSPAAFKLLELKTGPAAAVP